MHAETANSTTPRERSRLRYFPVAFFSAVMGLAGLTIAWMRAEVVFHASFAISGVIAWMTALAFVSIAIVYMAKLAWYAGEVARELQHPVRLNFFPTISIGLVLLSIVFVERHVSLARGLWIVGTALQFGFTLYVMNAWIHRTGIEVSHVNPAWFIPVVGNILVPIAGVRFFPIEVSWFFFSVGIVFWLVLLTIVMYRLFFHAPLPERLAPTLFILIAPPAVGFIAYFALTGTIDAFARILYYTALVFTLLLASNAVRFLKARFFLSAWAYSFPLAAVTIATLLMAHEVGGAGFAWIALALLAILTVVVALLLLRTVLAILRHEVCVEEG